MRLRDTVAPPLILIVLLGALAGTSPVGALTGAAVYWSAVSGAVLAGACAVAGRRLRLLTAEWIAVSVVLLFVVGGFVSSGSLRPDVVGFFDSVVNGWADLLSSVPPVAANGKYRVLPFVLGWLATTGGLALARVSRIPALAALMPLSVFGLGLLFSVELHTTALIQGGLLTAGSLALGWFQQRDFGFESDLSLGTTTSALRRGRVMRAVVLVTMVALVAPFVAARVPGFSERERFDLRDRLEPPWNPLDEPSPLARIKSNYVDEVKNEVVFTVRGKNVPQRWRLASLGVFDGSVWTVGDTSIGGTAPFVQIDDRLPNDPQWDSDPFLAHEDGYRSFEVEVKSEDAPWLPMPRNPLRLQSDSGDLRFNATTRTAARPNGTAGLEYTVKALPSIDPSDAELRRATFPFPTGLGLSKQAASVRNWAADLVEGDDRGWLQVEAVRDDLVENGFYLTTSAAMPGHSWKRLGNFFSNDEVYGFEEQYAAAAAIAVRNADLPGRVVVGYLIDEAKLGNPEIAVTRGEVSAWIEILTLEYGWVPVDVTPPKDNEPTLKQSGFREQIVAVPNPPPPLPPPSDIQVDPEQLDVPDDGGEDDEPVAVTAPLPVGLIVSGATATPLVIAALWGATVVAAKARRRGRRRDAGESSDRVAGAWLESNDRLVEAGVGIRRDESVLERARLDSLPAQSVGPMIELARSVDRVAFGPGEPTPAEADHAWRLYDATAASLRKDASWFERTVRNLNREPLKRVRGAR